MHALPRTTDLATAAAALHDANLRVTAQRVAVYAALAAHPHSGVDDVHASVKDEVPGIALQTVHGVVNDFTAAGIARRVSLPDASRSLYELDEPADNHHHIQCVQCGRVEDVPCALGKTPCLTPSETYGMRVLEATVTFRAICSDCERTSHE